MPKEKKKKGAWIAFYSMASASRSIYNGGRNMMLTQVTDESKCCCSCRHNIRTICHCEKDGHYIGYVANFDQVCEEWEKEE